MQVQCAVCTTLDYIQILTASSLTDSMIKHSLHITDIITKYLY